MAIFYLILQSATLIQITLVFERAAQTCYIIVIAYALYPIAIRAERFSKNNFEDIANEFEFVKKSLFVALPILVVVVESVLFMLANSSYAISSRNNFSETSSPFSVIVM